MALTPNYQLPPTGFGSYLQDAVPEDIAVSAGAFSVAMQQIKNIKTVDIERFAQVVTSIEVATAGLTLVNGTDVPVNTSLATQGQNILALGSGPNGGYTVSDFFGCMSGLPYSWQEMQTNIQSAQTTKLTNIYDQLYLATTWEGATVSVQYSTAAGPLYTITGLTITDAGGGYGRGGAVAPTISIAGGSSATATCTIGTDPTNAGSNGSGQYGRVITVTLTSAGSATGTIPTATIQAPPTATLAVAIDGSKSTSGINTASGTTGWPGMDTVVADYITQANTEIASIASSNPNIVNILNTVYNTAGGQLLSEQRTRYAAISPVTSPRDTFINQYPTTMGIFTDMIGTYAGSTYPHMYAQTLEAISDLSTAGGQSVVALMRQERNTDRLQQIGITLDNIIPVTNENMCPVLISNGTVPIAKTGIDVAGINGNVEDPVTTYTVPAVLQQNLNGVVTPIPQGYYDPNTNQYIKSNNTSFAPPIESIMNVSKGVITNTNLLGPENNGTGPARSISSTALGRESIQTGSNDTSVGGSNVVQIEPIAVVTVGAKVASGQGTPLDTGKAEFPGSLAGSKASNILPCTLTTPYTSSVLLPSTLDVAQAINEVINCNCDCWVD
jgi:hypothetical protein